MGSDFDDDDVDDGATAALPLLPAARPLLPPPPPLLLLLLFLPEDERALGSEPDLEVVDADAEDGGFVPLAVDEDDPFAFCAVDTDGGGGVGSGRDEDVPPLPRGALALLLPVLPLLLPPLTPVPLPEPFTVSLLESFLGLSATLAAWPRVALDADDDTALALLGLLAVAVPVALEGFTAVADDDDDDPAAVPPDDALELLLLPLEAIPDNPTAAAR